MKLHTKLYLFFAGMVLLPLLVVTVVVSLILSRSSVDTYEGRLQSGLTAASVVISAQAQSLAVDTDAALRRSDAAALTAGDQARRAAVLDALALDAKAGGAILRDPAGTVIAGVGSGAAAGGAAASAEGSVPGQVTPMIVSSVGIAGPDNALWQLTVERPFDTDALARVFSSQDLEWGLLENGAVSTGSFAVGATAVDAAGAPLEFTGSPDATGAVEANVDGSAMLASDLSLPANITDRPTLLMAAVPSDVIGASSRQALEAGLVLMLGVALMAGALGFLLARNITRPLRELTRAAAAGIEGDLGRKVEVRSSDEVGSLADSFGLMQSSIRDYIGELEESRTQLLLALSYAGEILGSTTDRARMMKTTAEAARLATGASGVWVELFPSRQPPKHGTFSMGVPQDFFDKRIRREVAVLSSQVASGDGVPGDVTAIDKDYEAFAFPLLHGHEALGAMVAIFEAGHPIQESRKILASLSKQAAVAVENVNFSELQELLATTDPMTNLFNFRYLCNCLDKEISKSRRYQRQLSVAILDIDDFKLVNDTFGHQAGDELLRTIGDTLVSQVREADMVARYGGEEFSVVFPETRKADAVRVAEKLRREVASIVLTDYPGLQVTTSIGVASYPEDGEDQTDLLLHADEALYHAKGAGKNRVIPA